MYTVQGPVMETCEHGNEYALYIKGGKYMD
jgi:hypothetical protein